MSRLRLHAILLTALVSWAAVARAQTVRGVVTNQVTRQPLGDALVGLQPVDSGIARQLVASTRTDDEGRFSIRAPVPGTYQLLVRRVGARPFTSPSFRLGSADESVQNAALDLFTTTEGFRLPAIAVRTVTPCRTSPSEAAQVATLWGLAREALVEADAADAGAFRNAPVIRYVRKLDPRSLEVLQEAVQAFDRSDVRNGQFFRSLPAESLSHSGYWAIQGNSTEFYGLDARSLLSEAFVRDHCFKLARESGFSPHRVGLTFEPIPQRNTLRSPPEIRGTVWLQAGSYELSRLRFAWTRLPGNARLDSLGGNIEFGRVATGPIEVRRWSLRMPQDILEIQGSGSHVVRVQRLGIIEEGGLVLAPDDTLSVHGGTASLSGTVRDGERRPLTGASVRLVGTDSKTFTDSLGRYRIAGIRSGLAYVVVEHDTYTALGMRVGESSVLFDDGAARTLSFTAVASDSIAKLWCEGRELPRNTGALRMQFVDSVTLQPVAGLAVTLFASRGSAGYRSQGLTDATGAVVHCGAPLLTSLNFEALERDMVRASGTVSLPRSRVTARVVRLAGRP